MKKILRLLIELPLYILSGLIVRKENRIVFGEWNGDRYTDNARYMFEYMKDKQGYELIWVGKSETQKYIPEKENTKFVEYGSLKAYYYILTSKYAFITHSQNDISKYNIMRKAIIIQLWHGIGIKNIGYLSSERKNLISKFQFKIQTIIRKYDYFICSSQINKERNLKAFTNNGITQNNTIESGQPRNTVLMNYTNNQIEKIKQKLCTKYNIPINKKIIMYMPTFRKNNKKRFSFSKLTNKNKENLNRILKKNNAIILEKAHQQDVYKNKKEINRYIYNVGNQTDINTQELLLIADILITDYSSCYLDYILLDRPIIHFAYDYEEYLNSEQGLYYDLDDIAGGDIVILTNELLKSLENNLINSNKDTEKRKLIRKRMLSFEEGLGSETIFETVFIKNK